METRTSFFPHNLLLRVDTVVDHRDYACKPFIVLRLTYYPQHNFLSYHKQMEASLLAARREEEPVLETSTIECSHRNEVTSRANAILPRKVLWFCRIHQSSFYSTITIQSLRLVQRNPKHWSNSNKVSFAL